MESEEYKHVDITRKIIGCAMTVHNHFGMGFLEIVYQRALVIELRKAGLKCESEVEKEIFYEGIQISKRRLDIIVEDKVLVEMKALSELDPASHNKILNYLRVFSIEVGLLLNFGTPKLQYKRFVR